MYPSPSCGPAGRDEPRRRRIPARHCMAPKLRKPAAPFRNRWRAAGPGSSTVELTAGSPLRPTSDAGRRRPVGLNSQRGSPPSTDRRAATSWAATATSAAECLPDRDKAAYGGRRRLRHRRRRRRWRSSAQPALDRPAIRRQNRCAADSPAGVPPLRRPHGP